jgi:DNA-binding response OmpR family regulator
MKTAHTVLVADRSRNSLRLLVETLPLVFPDWRVMGASTYLEVEELQRAHLLDLIILDTGISSTGRDSVELIRHWRNGGACTPIAASSNGSPGPSASRSEAK